MKLQSKSTVAKRGTFTNSSASGLLRRRPALLRGRFGTALTALCASALPLLASSVAHAAPDFVAADAGWTPVQWKNPTTMAIEPVSDGIKDESGANAQLDLVGTAALPSGYIYSDATYLYFRVRVDDTPLTTQGDQFKQFGWGCVIDSNNNDDTFEYLAMVDGMSAEGVYLYKNTSGTLYDAGDKPDTPALVSYPKPLDPTQTGYGYARVVPITPGDFNNDADFFVDWAVEWSVLIANGLNPSLPIRIGCGTSNQAQTLSADFWNGTSSDLRDILSIPTSCNSTGCINQTCTNAGQACSSGMPGVCDAGYYVCDAMGQSVCQSSIQPGQQTEICDNLDNDCNGTVDDGFNTGNACTNGVGQCQAMGVIACDAMGGASCNAVPLPPQAESCNNLDDDCDGVVDNGNPGGGMSCSTGLAGVCDAGTTSCAAGGSLDCVPSVQPGTQTETCNNLDDDCDGVVDNGFNLGAACTNGVGQCQTTGVIVCDGMGGATCDAVPGTPQQEICGDDLDSDCDGNNDNGCPTPECKQDSDCGGPTSGKVCGASTGSCIDGCRGTNGNGCPDGEVCSSVDDTIGSCMSGAGGAGGTGGAEPTGIIVQGNGIACSVRPTSESSSMAWMLGVAIGALAVARRRRR